MTESQSPQDGSFAAPRTGVPAGTEPYSGSYLDSPVETDTTGMETDAGAGTTGYGSTTGTTSGTGTMDSAKHEAAEVAGTARDAAGGVVETAKAEAGNVAQEVKMNARQLLTQTKGELADQAATQQQRVAEGLRSISDELSTMANSTQNGGVATDLVQQAAERSSSVARWLENRDPGSLLDEVKSFARRKPGTFLLLAAGAGVLAGRLGRGMADNSPMTGTGTSDATTQTPRAMYYPTQGGAVSPPAVDLPGPRTTTAGYGTTGAGTGAGYGTTATGTTVTGAGTDTGYDAGTTGGLEGSTMPYPETDAGGVKAQGDPLARPDDPSDPDDPVYGGPR
ncbi:hypothetical protein [Paenarthrobacter aromaticivorans]|uniref:ATP synthase F0 subunit B n=1 Tax=Paenarthrobacter aromaticivorans TaxID=2849150 RepID=A0ABS6I3V1_9MICC|nr:hypothetical protein [Paenarthrobacter sp. MMS21-TAE1-1]MBU8866339.1 hypothetical protein [Paenarthrobacter sp. MMS21-TAE1-1]